VGLVHEDVSRKAEKRDLHQPGPKEPHGDESNAGNDKDALRGWSFRWVAPAIPSIRVETGSHGDSKRVA